MVVICWVLPKWARDMNRLFIEMEMQMALKHVKGCEVSPIREMQTTAMVRHDFSTIRLAKILEFNIKDGETMGILL